MWTQWFRCVAFDPSFRPQSHIRMGRVRSYLPFLYMYIHTCCTFAIVFLHPVAHTSHASPNIRQVGWLILVAHTFKCEISVYILMYTNTSQFFLWLQWSSSTSWRFVGSSFLHQWTLHFLYHHKSLVDGIFKPIEGLGKHRIFG